MNIETVLLPELLSPGLLAGKTAVVFDVLRATTTMTAALAAGVREIRLFASVDEILRIAPEASSNLIRCGERKCLRPAGFELGNSPAGFTTEHQGKTVFMATTNGTKAILAAREADVRLTGALVNRSAVAQTAADRGNDVVLLCAGTSGNVAMEDVIGAGAVADSLVKLGATAKGDLTRIALRLFETTRANLLAALSEAEGGRNVIAAGLSEDIAFAARIDALDVVGIVAEQNGQTILSPAKTLQSRQIARS